MRRREVAMEVGALGSLLASLRGNASLGSNGLAGAHIPLSYTYEPAPGAKTAFLAPAAVPEPGTSGFW